MIMNLMNCLSILRIWSKHLQDWICSTNRWIQICGLSLFNIQR